MAEQEIKIPDIGGVSDVEVIELLVKAGDEIEIDTPLITLESDKASMEIPSTVVGTVKSLKVKLGDKVSEGDSILIADAKSETSKESKESKESDNSSEQQEKSQEKRDNETETSEPEKIPTKTKSEVPQDEPVKEQNEPVKDKSESKSATLSFAGPAVRRLARELGVDLTRVTGTGVKGRITKENLHDFVKSKLNSPQGLSVASTPVIDFSKFGEIEEVKFNKIKKLTGANLHSSWINIPHVTQFDEADITLLEQFRKEQTQKLKKEDYKLTILAFICKVVVSALKKFPEFNSSLQPDGEGLIFKRYYNLGFAADTPNGLVVPVIKNIDKLSVLEIAKIMSELSTKARTKGLAPAEMNGGCFTISSLGGITGTAFTPIINSPEVAILGVSRSVMKPVYIDGEFQPRLMLPLSLSYDHRVIDGAQAAYFTRYLKESLADIRKILL